MIRLLHRKEIEGERWDRIVSGSRHETVYPYTWYLDLVSEHWSALVMGNYEYIMPVIWKNILGIRCLYQPVSTQQLGVLSLHGTDPDPETVRMFMRKLPEYFQKGEYAFNKGNMVVEEPGFQVEHRPNYELELGSSYEQIRRHYSSNTKRNITRALQSGLQVTDQIGVDEFLARRRAYDPFGRGERVYGMLARLVNGLKQQGRGAIYGIRKDGRLIAAALFAYSLKRVIYLQSFSDPEGKEHRSMFRIIDAFIQLHAGKELILDFEGSAVASIARFFGGFGAEPAVFQRIRFSRLPWGFVRRRGHG